MADIEIERKRGGSVWPWILGLLLLLLLGWLLWEWLDDDREVVEEPAVVTEPVVADPATTAPVQPLEGT